MNHYLTVASPSAVGASASDGISVAAKQNVYRHGLVSPLLSENQVPVKILCKEVVRTGKVIIGRTTIGYAI